MSWWQSLTKTEITEHRAYSCLSCQAHVERLIQPELASANMQTTQMLSQSIISTVARTIPQLIMGGVGL